MSTLLGVQVTDPDSGDSAALIYSYEQGRQVDGTIGRIGAQIMGPGDGYIAQTTTDTSTWWAERNRLRLGACFEPPQAARLARFPDTPYRRCAAFHAPNKSSAAAYFAQQVRRQQQQIRASRLAQLVVCV